MFLDLIEGVVPIAAVAAILANLYATRQRRLRNADEALRSLGAPETSREGGVVSGSVGGFAVRYELRDGGRNRPHVSHCWVTLPTEVPRFEMELRRQTAGEDRDVEAGRAIDLILGDEAFDDAFVVEAAPADVARVVLDHAARTALLTFDPCRLVLERGELHFEKSEVLDDPAEIRRVVELCTGIVGRLHTLHGELREKRLAAAQLEGAGYRGVAPDALIAAATAPREMAEVLALLRARSTRRARDRAIAVSVGSLAAIALAVAAVAQHGCH